MSAASYVLGIVSALLVLVVVIELLRRGRLRERHTLWWLLAGTLGLIVAVFPRVLEGAASALGIEVPLNLVFFVSILVLFLVLVQQSGELTRLEERTRTLAEHTAALEDRIRELEQGPRGAGARGSSPAGGLSGTAEPGADELP
ncbi:DUF2304 domain-containing protein [Leucobacter massiliensis]|uniref:DUF2304 domain-containing protein n=1 Tax=Leucobacter massiliensis TaxID=1686285 RepID=A0A2S9QKU9_9MICO|nr:DUF2304 domain-containing protein [Leucobacter massiliensis]PRI10217.1 hypothetical protein B4915_12460 [Leucobacter massiliensis]